MNEILATVRLQFHRGFTLTDAEHWVDYYANLGISHFYASPLQASRAGSPHGYDGIDPTRIDPELGGEAALERLVSRLRSRGMGLILDIVPNHLAVGGSQNRWWQDVLAWGNDSPYAEFFDIDWHSDDPQLTGKLLVPFLGDAYADILQSGELVLGYDADTAGFHVDYHEHRFPIDPRHYGDILRFADHNALHEQAAFFDALQQREDAYTAAGDARYQLRKVMESPAARQSLDAVIALFGSANPTVLLVFIPCSSASITAWPGGAPLPMKLIGGVFSMLPNWVGYVSKFRRFSKLFTPYRYGWLKKAGSMGCESTMSMGLPTLAATACNCVSALMPCRKSDQQRHRAMLLSM